MKKRQLTPLTNLPLRPSTLRLLQSRGFSTVEELHEAKAAGMSQLAEDLGVSDVEAVCLCREVASSSTAPSISSLPPSCAMLRPPPPAKTASQLLEEASAFQQQQMRNGTQHIITFCRPLDQLVGGGIALGELTDVSGAPGAGKTQLAMQLAVTARLPVCLGGVEGETLYVDAEGTFSPERCWSMAGALASHVQSVQRKRRQGVGIPSWFTPQAILQGIHVYRVHDEAAQSAALYSLERRLRENPGKFRLIVIDSIAFHIRATMLTSGGAQAQQARNGTNSHSQNPYQRQRALLASLSSYLSSLASQYHVAVVAVNQMTTVRTHPPRSGGPPASEFTQVPALGEAWAHAVATRLLLHQQRHVHPPGPMGGRAAASSTRTCQLVKSPRYPPGRADFMVLEAGIREVYHAKRPTPTLPQQDPKRPKQGG
jgi:RAD51-like protein 2